MPLRWDPLLVRELARELDQRLAGTRLRALRLDGVSREMVLLFKEATLAWPLHPQRGAPLLLPAAEPGPEDLALPSRVRRIRAPADERILIMELLPQKGHGPRDLVVELLGNQWNAVLVEGPEARIRHVLVRRDGARPARVGHVYTPPTPSPRVGTDGLLPLTGWRDALEGAPPGDRPRTLVAGVAWTSPLNREALLDADPDPAVALDLGHALWRSWVCAEAVAPALLETNGGLQPYPWPIPGVPSRSVPTLLDAFRAWTDETAQGGPGGEAALPVDLVRTLERSLASAQRRRTSLTAQLQGVEDPALLRAKGDLLLARFGEVPSGATEVTLEDFTGQSVTVTLDPTRRVQENASAFYDRAARVNRALEQLPTLLDAAARTADTLEALLDRAQRGDVSAEELRAALPSAAPTTGRTGDTGDNLPYRRFRSSGGLEIRVGKGSRKNDHLTFRHSAPDDIWLHARHAAGAHVILRWGRADNPPARDLQEAAILAAVHSKARTSGTAPVDWTRRKHVRKPRGAAPGSVVPDRVKTLFVEPNEGLVEELREG